jgi:peroxiredoxin
MRAIRSSLLGAVPFLACAVVLSAGRVTSADDPPANPPSNPPAQPAAPEPPKAPDFTLKDVDGKERKLSEFADKWVVLEWVNLGCPFVKKHYDPGAMQANQEKYTGKGVVWLSICSSAPGKQGNLTPEAWKAAIAERKIKSTAVLLDGDGKVGKSYAAKTTPDMRIIDPKGRVVYTGAIDDNPAINGDPKAAKNYVADFLDAVLDGKEPAVKQTKSYGCSVKYAD